MANKRITDLPQGLSLVGTEALIMDQDSLISPTGIDTVQTTLSSIQEFTLSAAPFINVLGAADFGNNVDIAGRLQVTGDTEVFGGLSASGKVDFGPGDVDVNGDLFVFNGDLTVAEGQYLSGDDGFGEGIPLEEIFAYKGEFVQNLGGVSFIQRVTQAQYDALTPDPNTLYVIVG